MWDSVAEQAHKDLAKSAAVIWSRMLENNGTKAKDCARDAVDAFVSALDEHEKGMVATEAPGLMDALEAKRVWLRGQALATLKEVDTEQRRADALMRMDVKASDYKDRLEGRIGDVKRAREAKEELGRVHQMADAAQKAASDTKDGAEKATAELKDLLAEQAKLKDATAADKTAMQQTVKKMQAEVERKAEEADAAAKRAADADASVATKLEDQRVLARHKALFTSAHDNYLKGCKDAFEKDGEKDGASVEWHNPGDGNKTALLAAAQEGHEEIVAWLLDEAKAPFDAVDDKGSTALHLACANGEVKAAKLLLARGADIAVTNKVR
jgi:hypothetical protein